MAEPLPREAIARLLHGELTRRIELPPEADGPWTCLLVGALLSFEASWSPEDAERAWEVLGLALPKGSPEHALRKALARRSASAWSRLWGLSAHFIKARLADGETVEEASLALAIACELPEPARITAGVRAWSMLLDELDQLLVAICFQHAPSSGGAPQDSWLRWCHQIRRWEEDSARSHHFAHLLLAMARSPEALKAVRLLDGRLAERGAAPTQWVDVLRAVLLRAPLTGARWQAELRTLRACKVLEAWVLLGNEEPLSWPEWLTAAAGQLRACRAVSRGRVALAARFTARDGRCEVLTGNALAEAREDVVYVGELVAAAQAAAGLPGKRGSSPLATTLLTSFPTDPAARAAAAVADTLNQAAENFAVTHMPSLQLRGPFEASLKPWRAAGRGWPRTRDGGRLGPAALFLEATRVVALDGVDTPALFLSQLVETESLAPLLQHFFERLEDPLSSAAGGSARLLALLREHLNASDALLLLSQLEASGLPRRPRLWAAEHLPGQADAVSAATSALRGRQRAAQAVRRARTREAGLRFPLGGPIRGGGGERPALMMSRAEAHNAAVRQLLSGEGGSPRCPACRALGAEVLRPERLREAVRPEVLTALHQGIIQPGLQALHRIFHESPASAVAAVWQTLGGPQTPAAVETFIKLCDTALLDCLALGMVGETVDTGARLSARFSPT